MINWEDALGDTDQKYQAYTEIILKSKQSQKSGKISRSDPDPLPDGDMWITDGFDYPSFDPLSYTIVELKVIERADNSVRWHLTRSQ